MTTTDPETTPALPVTRTPAFWPLMGYAIVLGVFGAVFSLLFLLGTGRGGHWYKVANDSWWGGHWWWVAVTAAAGVVVGLVRIWTKLPMDSGGLIQDLQAESVDMKLVPGIIAVSFVSLIGGASLGPEKALGSGGAGFAEWLARKRKRGLDEEDTQVNTLTGFAGAYGGLFGTVLIVVMFILEVAKPGGRRAAKALPATIIAASVCFAIYFAVAGAVFLGLYAIPHFTYHGWQMAAGIGFGFLAAVVTLVLGIFVQVSTMLFTKMKLPNLVKSTIGGVLFGVVGVALPLTLFTGTDQLKVVLHKGPALGAALLAVLVVAKMFTFSVSQASGFVGGPIFPSLFIGGTTGVTIHVLFPSVPLGLVFCCMMAAVPGALVSAPFSMVLMIAFITKLGALETGPVLLAVITAYLTVEGTRYLLALQKQRRSTSTAGVGAAPAS
jgi:chloride channel protein, CIC family